MEPSAHRVQPELEVCRFEVFQGEWSKPVWCSRYSHTKLWKGLFGLLDFAGLVAQFRRLTHYGKAHLRFAQLLYSQKWSSWTFEVRNSMLGGKRRLSLNNEFFCLFTGLDTICYVKITTAIWLIQFSIQWTNIICNYPLPLTLLYKLTEFQMIGFMKGITHHVQ